MLKFTVLSFVCVRVTWLVGSSFLEYSGVIGLLGGKIFGEPANLIFFHNLVDIIEL